MKKITYIAILAIGISALCYGLSFGEGVAALGKSAKAQVIYDNSGNVEAVIEYSQPECKRTIVRDEITYAGSTWEMRNSMHRGERSRRYQ